MAQMRATTGTDDLSADSVGVRNPLHSTGDLIVETRPSTAGIEFVFRAVQRRVICGVKDRSVQRM